MHKLFSGKEHGFVPFFFFFYKGSVFSHSMATELLQSASLNSSPGLLSKPGPLETQCFTFLGFLFFLFFCFFVFFVFFFFYYCFPRKPFLTQKQTLLEYTEFHPVKMHAVWVIFTINSAMAQKLGTPCFANLSSQQSHMSYTQSDEAKHLSQGQTGIV